MKSELRPQKVSNRIWEVNCDSFRSVFGVICIKEFPRSTLSKLLDDIKISSVDDVYLDTIDSYNFYDAYGGGE